MPRLATTGLGSAVGVELVPANCSINIKTGLPAVTLSAESYTVRVEIPVVGAAVTTVCIRQGLAYIWADVVCIPLEVDGPYILQYQIG